MTSSQGIFCVQFFRFNLINVKLKLEHEQHFSTTVWSICFRLSLADWFVRWSHKLCSFLELRSPESHHLVRAGLVLQPCSLVLFSRIGPEGLESTLVKGKRCCFLCVPSNIDSLKWDRLRMFQTTSDSVWLLLWKGPQGLKVRLFSFCGIVSAVSSRLKASFTKLFDWNWSLINLNMKWIITLCGALSPASQVKIFFVFGI